MGFVQYDLRVYHEWPLDFYEWLPKYEIIEIPIKDHPERVSAISWLNIVFWTRIIRDWEL